MVNPKQFVLSLHKKEKVGKDVYSFYFFVPEEFQYVPGQYVQMLLPHKNADRSGSSRFFTIASAPHEAMLMITTRKTTSSFKRALFALEPGATIQCFGPIGTFVLDFHFGV